MCLTRQEFNACGGWCVLVNSAFCNGMSFPTEYLTPVAVPIWVVSLYRLVGMVGNGGGKGRKWEGGRGRGEIGGGR